MHHPSGHLDCFPADQNTAAHDLSLVRPIDLP